MGALDHRRQAGRVRLGADHRRRVLRAPRLSAGEGRRSHRRRRHVRRRLRRLHRQRELDGPPSDALLRNAMAYGTALASFNVEQFGTEGCTRYRRRRPRSRRGSGRASPASTRRWSSSLISDPLQSGPASGAALRCVSCACVRWPTPRRHSPSTVEAEAAHPDSHWSELAEARRARVSLPIARRTGWGWPPDAGMTATPAIAQLWGMWVDPALRGRGLGGRLVDEVAAGRRSTAPGSCAWA